MKKLSGYLTDFTLLVILLCSNHALATLEIIEFTKLDKNQNVQELLFNPLYMENAFFRSMYFELHEGTKDKFILAFIDPDVINLFAIYNGENGHYSFGGFVPPEISQEEITEEILLAKNYSSGNAKELARLFQGKGIIYVILRNEIDELGRSSYGVPDATILQEVFHAYQYKYYKEQGKLDRYFSPNFYPAMEVESDLANFVADIIYDGTFSLKQEMLYLDGMPEMLDHLTSLKKNNSITSDKKNQFDGVVQEMWDFTSDYISVYVDNARKVGATDLEVKFEDMASLKAFIKKYHLGYGALTKLKREKNVLTGNRYIDSAKSPVRDFNKKIFIDKNSSELMRKIKFYNVNGDLVDSREFEGKGAREIDINSLPKGTYFADITLKYGRKVVHKMVIFD